MFLDSIGNFNFATPVAFDSNNDGNDEVLISTTNVTDGFIHELVLIDFVTTTQSTIHSAPEVMCGQVLWYKMLTEMACWILFLLLKTTILLFLMALQFIGQTPLMKYLIKGLVGELFRK